MIPPSAEDGRVAVGLYPRLLGGEWDSLPPALRAAHFTGEPVCLGGSLEVEVGGTRLARLLRGMLRLPARGGTADATLRIAGDGTRELWSRRIGEWTLTTDQTARAGRLLERVECLEFDFRLAADGGRLRYVQQELRVRF